MMQLLVVLAVMVLIVVIIGTPVKAFLKAQRQIALVNEVEAAEAKRAELYNQAIAQSDRYEDTYTSKLS